MTPDVLERALTSLASEVEFPPTPDLTARVVAAINTRGPARRDAKAIRPQPAPQRRRLWPALATAAVVLFAAAMIAAPGARRAVADFLGIGGVRITVDEPPADPTPPGSKLGLGERVTLAEAEARAAFPLRFPTTLGPPDAVYVAEAEGFDQVTFAYDPAEGLPAAPGHQEGLLLAQFQGEPEGDYVKKLIFGDPAVDEVMVRGTRGIWVEGPHQISYIGPKGTLETDSTRLSAGALIWEEDGITYRLESDLSKREAVALAEAIG